MKGERIIVASWTGTAALAGSALAAWMAPMLDPVAVAVAVSLFAAGVVVFLWALAKAADRSRTEAIGMGGLFFLAGSAPPAVRRHLLGSLAAQTVVALGAASARPFTPAAFSVLVPVYGLALCGLWAAHCGSFGPRAGRQPSR